jgi:hypothetical protein
MDYLSEARTEFYRDTGIETALGGVEIAPLTNVLHKEPAWHAKILTAAGDLLINAGVKLKIAAQLPASFSEEIL